MRRQRADKRRCGPKTMQAGIGLIEILVAVVVLSVGILGIAALQTRALVGSGNSMARSMATVASYSIIDALIADRDNAVAQKYDTTVVASDCPGTDSLVNVQLNKWCESLANGLGAADTTTGTIVCDGNGNCKITIQWDDSRTDAGAGGGTQTLVTETRI